MRTTSQASKFALAILALWFGLGAETRTEANLVINTPAGLTAGDTFRIVFVTDGTTDATSTSISTYNTFVNHDATSQAGGGNFVYDGTTLTFKAIGLTLTTSAVANIGETGAPVYLANGTEVASSDTASGWWSGGTHALLHAIDTDLLGNTAQTEVWTGTGLSGHSADPLGGNGAVSGETTIGHSTQIGPQWMIGQEAGPTALHVMYGVSEELTVPQASSVPEPSTLWMASVGMLAGIAYGRFRRVGARMTQSSMNRA